MTKNWFFLLLSFVVLSLFLVGALYAHPYDGNGRGYSDGNGGWGCGWYGSDNDGERYGWRGRGGPMGFGHMGFGHMGFGGEFSNDSWSGPGFMHWGADLSDEQDDRIAEIYDRRFDVKGHAFEEMDEANRNLMLAIHSGDLDEDAIREAAEIWADLQADYAVDMAYMMQDVREILSDEQLERMDDWCYGRNRFDERDDNDDEDDYDYGRRGSCMR